MMNILLLCVIVFIIFKIYNSLFYSKPFTPKKIEEPKTHKVDIDKQLYSTKPGVIPEDIDAIVIGAGPSGLVCSALLALQGRRVLVLEQHEKAGGAFHVFTEEGFEFDTGYHIVTQLDNKDRIAAQVINYTTQKRQKFASGGEINTMIHFGDKKYFLYDGLEKTRDELKKKFPEHAEGLDRYFELLPKLYNEAFIVSSGKIFPYLLRRLIYYIFGSEFRKYGDRKAIDVYKNDFGFSEELASVFLHNGLYIGQLPYEMPFIMNAIIVYVNCFASCYPIGGTSTIAKNIIPTIESRGGKVLCKAMVKRIITKKGKAIGVEMVRGGHKIYAPIIISSTGVYNTYVRLLKDEKRVEKERQRVLNDEVPAVSTVCFYFGMDKSSEDLQLPKYVIRISPKENVFESMREYIEKQDLDNIQLFITFSSAHDPTFNERFPNKSTGQVICDAPYDWVRKYNHLRIKQRGEEYMNWKRRFMKKIEKILITHFPQLEGHIVFRDLGTPLSIEYYSNSWEGSYAGTKTLKPYRDWTPQTPIKNLYLTGQDLFCGGVYPNTITGLVTYIAITKDYWILKRLKDYTEKGI